MANQKVLSLYPEQIRIRKGFNVRYDNGDMKEFKAGIAANGIDVPILVIATKDKTEDNYPIYELIDGHRRVNAATALTKEGVGVNEDGYVMVPAIELDKTLSEQELILKMLNTGTGSKPLGMLEQAYAMERLAKEGLKPAEIARKTGKTQTHVSDCLLLLREGTTQIINNIKNGSMAASTAIELLKSNEPEAVEDAVEKAKAAKKGGTGKVTKKDISKADEDGKLNKKKGGGVSPATHKKGAENTRQQPGGKNGNAIAELNALYESMNAQTLPRNEEAFALLKGVTEYLSGKKDALDLVPMFFTEAPAHAPSKPAKEETPKKKSLKDQLDAIDTEDKPAKKAPVKKAAPKKKVDEEIDDFEDEEEEVVAKPKAVAAKKAAAPSEDEEEIDDFEDEEEEVPGTSTDADDDDFDDDF